MLYTCKQLNLCPCSRPPPLWGRIFLAPLPQWLLSCGSRNLEIDNSHRAEPSTASLIPFLRKGKYLLQGVLYRWWTFKITLQASRGSEDGAGVQWHNTACVLLLALRVRGEKGKTDRKIHSKQLTIKDERLVRKIEKFFSGETVMSRWNKLALCRTETNIGDDLKGIFSLFKGRNDYVHFKISHAMNCP